MTTIRGIYYVRGFDDSRALTNRRDGIYDAYNLTRFVEGVDTTRQRYKPDFTTLNGSDFNINNITKDGWYVVTIDTRFTDQAKIQLLSERSKTSTDEDVVLLVKSAADRYTTFDAGGGRDTYVIAESFYTVAKNNDTATRITISDDGENVFHFRDGVVISRVSITAKGSFQIYFGGTDHADLIIQKAAAAKFIIGTNAFIGDPRAREYLELSAQQFLSYVGYTDGSALENSKTIAPLTNAGGTLSRYDAILMFVFSGNNTLLERYVNEAFKFGVDPSALNVYDNITRMGAFTSWVRITKSTNDGEYVSTRRSSDEGTDAAESIWIFDRPFSVNTVGYTIKGGGGQDEYVITRQFQEPLERNSDNDLKITIEDSGVNVIRFRDGVKISSSNYDATKNELTLGFGVNPHKSMKVKDVKDDKFKIGDNSNKELSLTQFLNLVTGATTSDPFVVETYPGGIIPLSLQIYTPPIRHFILYHHGTGSLTDFPLQAKNLLAQARDISGDVETGRATVHGPAVTAGKWHHVAYDPLYGNGDIRVLSDGVSRDNRVEEIWLGSEVASRGKATSISAGNMQDKYIITTGFTEHAKVSGAASPKTEVTITDGSANGNLYRFHTGVKISSAELNNGVLEISFGSSNHKALKIQSPDTGKYLIGNTSNVALNRKELQALVHGAEASTSNPYTIPSRFEEKHRPDTGRAIIEQNDPTDGVTALSINYTTDAQVKTAYGSLKVTDATQDQLATFTHTGENTIFGEFDYLDDRTISAAKNGNWTYTLDMDSHAIVRLADQTAREIITFNATDNDGEVNTRQIEITITVTGEAEQNAGIFDRSEGKASTVIYGVHFENAAVGRNANNIRIHVKQATSGENRVEKTGDVYTIYLKADAIVGPESLWDLWNADDDRRDAITATILDSRIDLVRINQVLGRYKFFGGENSDSVTVTNDKQVVLNWGADDVTANNALKASGRLAIRDDQGGQTVVASEGRYGAFNITNPSTNIYDWTYTLNHESNLDVFTLRGVGATGPATYYDVITIKVTDKGTGGLSYDRVTYHHLPIAIEVTGRIDRGFFVIDDMVYRNESMSDSGVTLNENEAYIREVIKQVIFRDTDGSVINTSNKIELDDASVGHGFWYNPLRQELTFTGTLDFENLTDRDDNTPGTQYFVELRLLDRDGSWANHNIAITVEDVLEPPHPIVPLPIIPLTAFVGHAWSWTAPEFASQEGRDITGYAARKVAGESTTALPTWLDFDPTTRTFSIDKGATDSDDIAQIAIALEVATTDESGAAVKHIVHIPLDVTPIFTPDPLPPKAVAALGRVTTDDGEDIFIARAVNRGISGNDITISFIADTSIPTSAVEFDIVGGTSVIARYDVNKRASVGSFLEDAAADAALSALVRFTKAEGVDDDLLLSDADIITEGAVAPAEKRVVNVAEVKNFLEAGGLVFTEKKAASSPLRVSAREGSNVAAEMVRINFEPDLGAQLQLILPAGADNYPTLAVVKAAIEVDMEANDMEANDYFTVELADGKMGTDKITAFGEFTGLQLTGGRDAGTETLPAVDFAPGAAVQLSGGSGDEIEDVAASITAGGLVFTYKIPGDAGNDVEVFMGDSISPIPASETARVEWRADLNRLIVALAPVDRNTGSEKPTLATVMAEIEANEEVNSRFSVELAEGSSGTDRAVDIMSLPGFSSSVVRLSGGVGESPMATHASVDARGIIFTAVEAGTAGNGIEITHVFERNSNEPDIKFDDSEGRKIIFNTVRDPRNPEYPTLGYLMDLVRAHEEISKHVNVALAPGKNRNDRPERDFIANVSLSKGFITKGGTDLIIGLDKKPFIEIHGVRFIPVEDDHGQMGIKFGRGNANDFTISTTMGFYVIYGPLFVHDKPITPDKIIEAWTGGTRDEDLTRHQKILAEPAPGVPPPTRTFQELRDFVTDVFGGSILFADATLPFVVQLTATDNRPPLLIVGTSGNDAALNVGTHNRALLVDGMGGDDTITLGGTSEEIIYRHLTDGEDTVNGFTLGSDKIAFVVAPPAAGESLPAYNDLLTGLDTFVRLIYSTSDGGQYTGIIFAFMDSLRVNFTEALDEAALMEAMGLADAAALNAIFHGGSKPTASGNARLSNTGIGMLNALLGGDEETTFIRVVDAVPEYETSAVGITLAYNNSGIIEADTNLITFGDLFANPATTEPVITHNGADTTYGKFTYDTDTSRWTYTLDAHHPDTATLEDDAMETITFTVTDSATGRAYTHDLVIAIEVTGTPSWLGNNDDTEFRDTSPDPLPYLEIHGVRFSVLNPQADGTNGIRINLRAPADMDGNAIGVSDNDELYLITLAADEADMTAARLKALWDNLGDGAAARRAVIKADLITDLDPGATTPPPAPKATLAGDNYFHGKHPAKPMVEVHGVRFTYIGEADLPTGLSIKFKEKEGAEEHGITYKASPGLWSIVLDSAVAATLTPEELVLLWNKGTAAAPTNDGTGGRAARLEQIRASLVDGTIAAADPEDLAGTGTNSDGVHAFAMPDPATPSPLPTAATVVLDHHDSDHSILQTNGRLTITDTDGVDSVEHNGEATQYGVFSFDKASGLWAYRLNPNDPDTAALTANTMEVITFMVMDEDDPANTTPHDLQIAININGTSEATLTDETVFRESDSTGAPARKPPAVIIHGVEFTIQGADPADGYALKVNTNAVASKISLGADGLYVINLKNDNAAVTAETLENLWNTDTTSDAATRMGLIKATILNDATEDATAASLKAGGVSGTYAFTPAPAHYVVLSLDNSDDNVLKASGQLTITDTDAINTITHNGDDADYGNFTFDADTGAWEYTLNPRSPRVAQITARGRIEETITFTVTDAANPANTATYELDIGINVVADGAPGIPGGSLEDITVEEGEGATPEIPEFLHIDSANVTLTYTVTVVGTKPAWLTLPQSGTDLAARTLTIADTTDDVDVGVVMLTVSVSDGTNTTIAPLKLIIENVNEAPSSADITTTTVTATEDMAAVSIPANFFTFTDPDGDALHSVIITEGAEHGILLLGDKVLIPGAEASENNTVSFADLQAGNLKFDVLPSASLTTATTTFKFKVADAGGLESVQEYTATIGITGVDTKVSLVVTPAPIQFTFRTSVTLTTEHLSISDPDTEDVDTDAAIFTLTAISGGSIEVDGSPISRNGTFTQAQVAAGQVVLHADKIGSFSVRGRFESTNLPAQEITFTTDSTVFESDATSLSKRRVTLNHDDSTKSDFEIDGTLTITDTDGITVSNVTHNGANAMYGAFIFTPASDVATSGEYDWSYTLNPGATATIELDEDTHDEDIIITVMDDAGTTETYVLELKVRVVGELNVPPVFTDGARAAADPVPENADLTTWSYTATATDENNGDDITYTLEGADAEAFEVSDAGVVTFKSTTKVDFETQALYTFTVKADDGRGGTAQQEISVTITDENDFATGIELSNGGITLEADTSTATATRLATITITDLDGDPFGTLEVVDADGNISQLIGVSTDNTELQLKAGASITPDTMTTVTLRLAENHSLSVDYTLTIAEAGVTNTPAEITPSAGPHAVTINYDNTNNSVREATGTITITDEDGLLGTPERPEPVTASGAIYGTFTITQDAGNPALYSWMYTFDEDTPASIALGAGTATENITITVIDDQGFESTHTLMIGVTVSGNIPPRATPNTAISVAEEDTYTFTEGDFGFSDSDSTDTLTHITITALPDAGDGVLKLNGQAVSAGDMITSAQLRREAPANSQPTDPQPTGLVFEPVQTRDQTFDASFTYTVSDGDADSAEATMSISVSALDADIVLNLRENIGVDIDVAHVFSRHQINVTDPDSEQPNPSDVTFNLTAITEGAIERYDSASDSWISVTLGASNFFTQEDINNGHVRLTATGSGSLTVTVRHTPPDGNRVDLEAQTMTFTLREAEEINGKEIGYAGGDERRLDLGDEKTHKSIITGLGDTKIKPGSGDDRVDPGLGDDEVDLTAGGDDIMIYRYRTVKNDSGTLVATIAWDGGDTITGFTPGEDKLLLLDIGAGNGGTPTPTPTPNNPSSFIDGLGTGFIATLATAYTGGNGGNNASRDALNNYNITGIDLHFSQALLLPGGVLGGSILSITFQTPITWANFNARWFNNTAGTGADTPFNTTTLQFNDNDAGKSALRNLLNLNDIKSETPPSVAVGSPDADTIDLTHRIGPWIAFGGTGDDTITLGIQLTQSGAGQAAAERADEVIYRLTHGTDADNNTAITASDGSDTIHNFALGTDKLTFIAGDPARGEVAVGQTAPNNGAPNNAILTIRTKTETDAFNGLAVTIATDASLTATRPVAIDYTAPTGTNPNTNPGSLTIRIDDEGATYADILAVYADDADKTTSTFAAHLDFIIPAADRMEAVAPTPPPATPADTPAITGGSSPLTVADILDASVGVSLRVREGTFTYDAIIFTLTPDDPATTGTDETTTLTLNFKLGVDAIPGTDLTNADLMRLLGLADDDAAVGALFADATADAPRDDGEMSGRPVDSGTFALSDAGIMAIAGIFGDAPLATDATLPTELL